jgi:hypothetical protein
MSNRQVETAKLVGWEGPIFPPAAQRLHNAWSLKNRTGSEVRTLSEKVPGFTGGLRRDRTTDGYGWFWSLEFAFHAGGQMKILLPWAQDWSRQDGTLSDRHLAVYTKGSPSLAEIESVILLMEESNG